MVLHRACRPSIYGIRFFAGQSMGVCDTEPLVFLDDAGCQMFYATLPRACRLRSYDREYAALHSCCVRCGRHKHVKQQGSREMYGSVAVWSIISLVLHAKFRLRHKYWVIIPYFKDAQTNKPSGLQETGFYMFFLFKREGTFIAITEWETLLMNPVMLFMLPTDLHSTWTAGRRS